MKTEESTLYNSVAEYYSVRVDVVCGSLFTVVFFLITLSYKIEPPKMSVLFLAVERVYSLFRCVHASLYKRVCPSVGPSGTRFFHEPIMGENGQK